LKGIKVFNAHIRWIVRCRICGEMMGMDQNFLDFTVTKKIRKLDRCPSCEAKGRFYEIVLKESVIVSSEADS